MKNKRGRRGLSPFVEIERERVGIIWVVVINIEKHLCALIGGCVASFKFARAAHLDG